MQSRKYKLSDLKVGMQVKQSELSHITNIHFILTNTKIVDGNDIVGTLEFFGNNLEEATECFMQTEKPITPLYFYDYGYEFDE